MTGPRAALVAVYRVLVACLPRPRWPLRPSGARAAGTLQLLPVDTDNECAWSGSVRAPNAGRATPGAMTATGSGSTTAATPISASAGAGATQPQQGARSRCRGRRHRGHRRAGRAGQQGAAVVPTCRRGRSARSRVTTPGWAPTSKLTILPGGSVSGHAGGDVIRWPLRGLDAADRAAGVPPGAPGQRLRRRRRARRESPGRLPPQRRWLLKGVRVRSHRFRRIVE